MSQSIKIRDAEFMVDSPAARAAASDFAQESGLDLLSRTLLTDDIVFVGGACWKSIDLQQELPVSLWAEWLRAGIVTVEAEDEDLNIEPLADTMDASCYPDTNLIVSVDNVEVGRIPVWVVGYYHSGDGYDGRRFAGQWTVDSDDGAYSGRPRVDQDGEFIVLHGGAHMNGSIEILIDDEENEEDVNYVIVSLEDLLDTAYGRIDASPADDDRVRSRLLGQRVASDYLGIDWYGGEDAGRKVWAFEESNDLFDDADSVHKAIRNHLMELTNEVDPEIVEEFFDDEEKEEWSLLSVYCPSVGIRRQEDVDGDTVYVAFCDRLESNPVMTIEKSLRELAELIDDHWRQTNADKEFHFKGRHEYDY